MDSVPKFRFAPCVRARILSVYDGDTVTAAFQHDTKLQRFRVRLVGIDAPELRTKDEQERAQAVVCRDTLRAWVLHRIVFLLIEQGEDKYGRVLARIVAKQDTTLANDATLSSYADCGPRDTCPHVEEFSNGRVAGKYVVINEAMLQVPGCVPYDGKSKPVRG